MKPITKKLIWCMIILIFIAVMVIFVVLPLYNLYKPVSDNETTNESTTNETVANGTTEEQKTKTGTILLVIVIFAFLLVGTYLYSRKRMPFFLPDQQEVINQLRDRLVKERGLHFEDDKGSVLQTYHYSFASKRQFPRLLVIFSLKRRSILNVYPNPAKPPRHNIITVDLPFKLPVKKYNFLGHFYLHEALKIIVDSHFGRAPSPEPEKQELFPMAGETKAEREGRLEAIREEAKAREEEK